MFSDKTSHHANGEYAGPTLHKPALLMLSHCVPDAIGSVARGRAWELLRLASQTHRVHLAAIVEAPVDLAQWRALKQETADMALQMRHPITCLIDHARQRLGAALSPAAAHTDVLRQPTWQWQAKTEFDVVVCTHPQLLAVARQLPARLVLCDMRSRLDTITATDTRKAQRQLRQIRDRLAHALDAFRAPVTLVVSPEAGATALMDDLAPTLCVPEGIDLSYYMDGALLDDSTDAEPRVLLHADGRDRGSRRQIEWFVRKVWPRVREAVPHARLQETHAARLRPTSALRQASVVAALQPQPASRFAMLQAMAMHRPIVAAAPAAALTGARHGEHLLLSHTVDEWVSHCREALRSASVRMQLARAARSFVELHGPISRTGKPILQALRTPEPAVLTPLRHAA